MVPQALNRLKQWWVILTRVETDRFFNEFAREAWGFFAFPDQVYVWETLVRLSEVDFTHVPGWVKERITKVFHAILVSFMAEQAARNVRQREKANVAKKLSMGAKWHSVATSRILKEHDRKPIFVTDSAKNLAPATLPLSTYSATTHDHSLGPEVSSTLTGKATWLNCSPERRELCYVSWVSFLQVKADYAKHHCAWQSFLAPVGHIIYDSVSNELASGGSIFINTNVLLSRGEVFCAHAL
jgi:hypothetical protein